MKKSILILLAMGLTSLGYAQTTTTQYFSDHWLTKETAPGKGKFSQTTIEQPDGMRIIEVKNVNKNELLSRQAYKGQEPYGVWLKGATSLDYNFPLTYTTDKCVRDTADVHIDNPLQDNAQQGYQAPRLVGGYTSIYQYLAQHIKYPEFARNRGIEGKVYVRFTITPEGAIEDISVWKGGVEPHLDKEALRVVRGVQFASPPLLNGQPHGLCLIMPITFRQG